MKIYFPLLLGAMWASFLFSSACAQSDVFYLSGVAVLDKSENFRIPPMGFVVDFPVKTYFMLGGFAGYTNYQYSRTHFLSAGFRCGMRIDRILDKMTGGKWPVDDLQMYGGVMYGTSYLINLRQEGVYGSETYWGPMLGLRYHMISRVALAFEVGRTFDTTYGYSLGLSFALPAGKK